MNFRWILSLVWMLGGRMTEVICLSTLTLDCFYRCCWFVSLEFSNFDLGLKGSIFLISCALHENYGCTCLLESAHTSLTIPSPLNKHEMWHCCVPVLLVLFFSLLSVSFLSRFCTFPCFFFPFWRSTVVIHSGQVWFCGCWSMFEALHWSIIL